MPLPHVAFHYSPITGAKFTKKSKHKLEDEHNGFTYYIDPVPAVNAIIESQKNEVLVVQRAREPKKDTLDFPGGFIDVGENAEQALAREIQEELQIQLKISQYLGTYYDVYPGLKLDQHVLVLMYICKFNGDVNQINPTDDVANHQWIPKTELANIKMGFPSMQKALNDYLQFTSKYF